MQPKTKSAGILLFRLVNNENEFFLVHPGGPFWAKKDIGTWSIPKGEFATSEDPLTGAIREFFEETGVSISGNFIELEPVIQKAGKQVFAWALEGNIDPATIKSNSFKTEWPPKSGLSKSFPEVDKAAWFDANTAKEKINPAQVSFIEQLLQKLKIF